MIAGQILMSRSIDKKKLWRLIIKDLNYSIHISHIFSVINILIDELIRELKSGKEISIKNFGVFKIKTLKPKKIISVRTGKVKFVERTKALRFVIAKRLTKLIRKSIPKCGEKKDQ